MTKKTILNMRNILLITVEKLVLSQLVKLAVKSNQIKTIQGMCGVVSARRNRYNKGLEKKPLKANKCLY
tara:strand:+ start:2354 stop:2560 length:207 start_codon:yes stop_codon:yes gene_type:complete